MLNSLEYRLFPNACFVAGIVIPLIHHFSPLGVDRCIDNMMRLQPLLDKGPSSAPAPAEDLDIHEFYISLDNFNRTGLRHVLVQDGDNFKRQWAGIKASKKGHQTLGNYQQVSIKHFHTVLEIYLYGADKAAID